MVLMVDIGGSWYRIRFDIVSGWIRVFGLFVSGGLRLRIISVFYYCFTFMVVGGVGLLWD